MSDKDYFRLALEGIEDDLKVDFKSGLGFGLIKDQNLKYVHVFLASFNGKRYLFKVRIGYSQVFI